MCMTDEVAGDELDLSPEDLLLDRRMQRRFEAVLGKRHRPEPGDDAGDRLHRK